MYLQCEKNCVFFVMKTPSVASMMSTAGLFLKSACYADEEQTPIAAQDDALYAAQKQS